MLLPHTLAAALGPFLLLGSVLCHPQPSLEMRAPVVHHLISGQRIELHVTEGNVEILVTVLVKEVDNWDQGNPSRDLTRDQTYWGLTKMLVMPEYNERTTQLSTAKNVMTIHAAIQGVIRADLELSTGNRRPIEDNLDAGGARQKLLYALLGVWTGGGAPGLLEGQVTHVLQTTNHADKKPQVFDFKITTEEQEWA